MLNLNNNSTNFLNNNFTINLQKRNIPLQGKFCNISLQNLRNEHLNKQNVKKICFSGKFLSGDYYGKVSGKIIDRLTNKPIDSVIISKKDNVLGIRYILYAEKVKGLFIKCGFMSINNAHITTLDSRDGNKLFKNIGKTFLELADELSYKTYKHGEVSLSASNIGGGSPVTFYRKMGFTSGRQFIDEQIDNALKNGVEYHSSMLPMYLPENEILKRQNRLKKESFINPDIPDNSNRRQKFEWLDFVYDWIHKFNGTLPEHLLKKARSIAEEINSVRYKPDDYYSV